ncbi:MAG TPA: NAD(P)/FAD-dependent oxidoreductase [Kiloniellaceae bacterium]|nr:NAD(P)/FAD-dependent oxidoreductase [Kiloniellaceae bacterium]
MSFPAEIFVSRSFDVIILGAGAAGLMAAAEAGKRGRSVLVLEKAAKPAEKIRISGGGRCNFTNLQCSPANFLSRNPRFCVSALKRFTQRDFLARVEAAGIAWHEKTLGQLFCDGASQQIIDMLLKDCAAAGVTLLTEAAVTQAEKRGARFHLATTLGDFDCTALVVATGGPSIPKMGASGYAYDLARQFGLKVVPPRPALVPFTFDPLVLEKLKPLSGVSTEAIVSCGKVSFREALLFTHRGLSGPAILQISSYWQPGEEIVVDLLPGRDAYDLLRKARGDTPKQEVQTFLSELLPRRLALMLCDEAGLQGRLADLSDKKLRAVADLVNRWRLKPGGTEGYRTAEVTAGGVDTDEISSKTFEAKKVPGLYFVGECLDVTGWLGGYNFQWAWSSGHAAGQAV